MSCVGVTGAGRETAHERLWQWTADGTWDKILAELIVRDDAVGEWVIGGCLRYATEGA